MKRKLIALATAAACLISPLSGVPLPGRTQTVSAAEETVTGDFVIEDGVLTEYTGIKPVVKIPEGVREIAKKAFINKQGIEKVIFPSTLRSIGSQAFSGCTALTSVEMPYRLREIGWGAFAECEKLHTLDLSMTQIEIINQSTFRGCTSLTEVILPDTVGIISGEAFSDCTYLGKINLPEGLTAIRREAFEECTSLVAIELPDSLQYLGARAFEACQSLQSVRIPAGIKTLPERVFYADYNIKSMYLPDTLCEIGEGALFTGELNGSASIRGTLEELYIPESVEHIYRTKRYADDDHGLAKFSGIERVLGKKGSYAEKYEKSMENVKITEPGLLDESLTDTDLAFVAVEDNAVIHFDSCGGRILNEASSKKGIIGQMYGKLPVPALKGYTFAGWYQDKALQVKAKTTTLITEAETTLYAKWEKEEEKEEVYQGNVTDFIIEEGVMKKYTGKESVVIVPEQVVKIGSGAFRENESVRKIVLPESVTEIGTSAFSGCTHLEELNIPSKVTEIPDSMCGNCVSLREIILPEGVTKIGESAFSGKVLGEMALSHVELPETLESIGQHAFCYCSNLIDLRLPDSLKEIGRSAFSNAGLHSICIPAGVKTLLEDICGSDNGLSEIRLQNGLETIGDSIISSVAIVDKIYIPETVKEIDPDALSNMHYSGGITIVGVKPGPAYDYYEALKMSKDYADMTINFEKLTDEQKVILSFNTGLDGKEIADRETYAGLTYGTLPELAADGKIFDGWKVEGSEGSTIKGTDVIQQSDAKAERESQKITLTAVWEAKEQIPEGTPIVPEPEKEEQEEKKVVEIHTVQELSNIRNDLQGHYKLMTDLDLSVVTSGSAQDMDGYGFRPIGAVEGKGSVSNEYTEKAFTGVFDGNGHTISGLTIQGDTPYVGVGLFARVEGGTIRDLNLKDVQIEAGSSTRRVGAAAGLVDAEESTGRQGTIENVTVSGKVGMTTKSDLMTQIALIGGAVGYVGDAVVSDVKNTSEVSYWSKEEEKPTAARSRYIGGVSAYLSGGTLKRCSNTGAVNVYRNYYGEFLKEDVDSSDLLATIFGGDSVYLYTGGITGLAALGGKRAVIQECYNTGDIFSVMNNRKALSGNIKSSSDAYTGGIVGALYGNTKVADCYNKGEVYGKTVSSTSLLGENAADANALRKYLDANTVKAPTNATAYTAGIAGSTGSHASGPIIHCYNTGELSGSKDCIYGIAGGKIPVLYSRYAAMTIKQEEEEIALTGSKDKTNESIIGCYPLKEAELAEEESYRDFGFGGEWILENTFMKTTQLLNNMENRITSAEFVTDEKNPVQTDYEYGEKLNLTGLKMKLQIEGQNDPVMIDVTASDNTGYDPYKPGDQTLKITCVNQTMELKVHVAVPTYELLAKNGNGAGYYQAGTTVSVQADEGPEDKRFLRWVVIKGEAEIAQPDQVETKVTMTAKDCVIQAEYEQLYEVKVTNGTGSGFYGIGDTVTVIANQPEDGYVFDEWEGSLRNNGSAKLENPKEAEMTFVIPEDIHSYPLRLTAKYKRAQQSSTPTPAPSETEQPKPSETPKATETPKPTETPKATETPKPTETPKATETPKPTVPPVNVPGNPGSANQPKATEQPGQGNDSTISPGTPGMASGSQKQEALSKVVLKKVKNRKGKKILVQWKKLKKAKGYQVQYAANKKFKKTSKLTKANKYVSKKLKKKTYYVRVRAYQMVNGKKVYGKWSAVKKVKVKK